MAESGDIISDLYTKLFAHYGPQQWWPAETAYEMMVGAVLTQNTAWTNVEHALTNLRKACVLSPAAVLDLHSSRLARLLRPSGCYNLKTQRVRALSRWLLANGGHTRLSELATEELRASLSSVKGVGPETADAILLYAFGRPVFVVDAYTRRILRRVGVLTGEEQYETIQGLVEAIPGLGAPDYNEYHALIVEHAKRACLKVPRCEVCCAKDICRYAELT